MDEKRMQSSSTAGLLQTISNAGRQDHAENAHGRILQYVTFTIGQDEYAVDITSVREIKAWSEPTMLPNQPPHMLGVLNLRGAIVPIFDLRRRFGQGMTEPTKMHVNIILAVGERLVGVLVDTVSDILSIDEEEIRPAPRGDRIVDTNYLSGLVTVDDHMVVILDTNKLFDQSDLESGDGISDA
jgi:purine-binding chemotaxis protein CheW